MDSKIIAHRGASGLVEFDNSIESFKKAIELGADMVEFDVRRTKDDVLIAFHDPFLNDKKISELEYKEILEKTKREGYKVPTVKEVVKLCKGKIDLDIELKEKGYEKELIQLVVPQLDYDEFMMKSFKDEVVKSINELDPKIETGLILGVEEPENKIFTRLSELFPKCRLKRCEADFVCPNHRLLKLFFLKRMDLSDLDVYVWTVNDGDLMKKLVQKQVKGIITDRPDIALQIRE